MGAIHKAAVGGTLFWALAATALPGFGQTLGNPAAAARTGEKLDVAYVTPDAVFGAVVFPRRVLSSPMVRMNPMLGSLVSKGKEQLGFDLLDLEQLQLVVGLPSQPGEEPDMGMVLRLSKAYDADAILPRLREKTGEGALEGKSYRQAKTPRDPSIYMADDRTLLVGQDTMLRKMVAHRSNPVAGRLGKVLGRYDDSNDVLAILLVDALRPSIQAQMAKKPVPPQMAAFAQVPNLIDTFGMKLNVTGSGGMMLSARCPDEAAAKQLEQIINGLLAMARMKIASETQGASADANPMARQMQQQIVGMLDMFKPVRKGNRLEVVQEGPGSTAAVGMTTAMLLPAIQAAREAARRTVSINNMKQLGLSMHNYHDANKTLPARIIVDAEGKPLLSWRVHMLPYLEEGALYKEFHLDEPWDSPHNKKLIERMPDVFRNPSSNAPPNTTTYLMPAGPGTIGEGKEGVSFRGIADGLANTILLVEANDDRAVIWTRPDDWRYAPDDPLAGLGTARPGGFNILMCDGSVHFRPVKELDLASWKAMLTFAGKEPVQ